jgi:transcription termination factor NusB
MLAHAGAPLVVETLAGLANGTIHPQPQNHSFATFAPLLDREDGRMDFAARDRARALQSLARLSALARRVHYARWQEAHRHRMALAAEQRLRPQPRPTRPDSHSKTIALRRLRPEDTWLEFLEVQLEGKKRLAAAEFLRGTALAHGARLGVSAQWFPQQGRAQGSQESPCSAARKAAFDVLMAVERGHSHSDDLLRGKAVSALSPPDRNLATTLVLGVLRWQIRLDHQLQALLKHPNAKLDTEIRIALRLGAFQLLHLDRIPARAAIDESVELAKQAGHRFASGMVNAVLRKLAGRVQSGASRRLGDLFYLFAGTGRERASGCGRPCIHAKRPHRFPGRANHCPA